MKINSSYTLRSYHKDDYDAVKKLWLDTGLDRPERGDDKTIIEKSIKMGGKLLVMEDKETGTICGSSWMTFDGRRIHLHHFGILPGYQGKGLSKLLLKKSLEFAKKKGYQVKIEVHRANEKALNLYRKAGFGYLGDYDVYIVRDVKNLDINDYLWNKVENS